MTWTIRPRSDAGSLAAITSGDGPLVVLVHGVGLRAEAWGAQIDALSQTYRVLAVDLPGHGDSPCLTPPSALAEFTDSIIATLDAPAVVVGHSFGAMIALDIAIRYGDQIKGVVALNAIFQRDRAAKAAVTGRANSLDGLTMADPTAPLQRWFGAEPSSARAACDQWLRAVPPEGYRTAYRIFAREDGPSAADLRSLQCPALFVTGAQEPNSTPAMSQAMAVLVSNGRAEILDGAAHMLPMTHAPHFNTLLAEFIATTFEGTN